MVRAVILDFDGVIINSVEVQRLAFFESYKLIGGMGKPSFNEFLSHSGDSLPNILKKMVLPLEMVEPYREISRKNINQIIVYDGMKDILTTLKKKKLKCGLCTGKDRVRTIEILQMTDLYDYFDTIVCSDDVAYPKPHPESLLSAIKNIGCSNESSVMVGDAVNDIVCAKKAGVKSIGVTWGDIRREVLEKEFPDCIVEKPDQLYANILRLLDIE